MKTDLDAKRDQFWQQWDILGRLSYWFWTMAREKPDFIGKMRTGLILRVRQRPTSDSFTLREIFGRTIYAPPWSITLSPEDWIVDMGAKGGYSLLYWSQAWPENQILAFEPHYQRARLAHWHIERNMLEGLIEFHAKAAAIQSQKCYLTADGIVSTSPPAAGTEIEAVDWHAILGQRTVGILKMDIKGSEYAILADPRFAAIPIRYLVMKWHHTANAPAEPEAWCCDQLNKAGFTVTVQSRNERGGLLWGRKKTAEV
jgi:FkbM family methyltransferase